MTKNQNNQEPELLEVEKLQSQLDELTAALALSQERERRTLADYQNLIRQQQQQRASLVKMANLDLLSAILQPIEHLSLASEQIKDEGLEMIIRQLWQQLNAIGLEEIEVLGKKFDLDTMEVVEKKDKAQKVVKVLRPAYRLNGQIIQHAQVVLG